MVSGLGGLRYTCVVTMPNGGNKNYTLINYLTIGWEGDPSNVCVVGELGVDCSKEIGDKSIETIRKMNKNEAIYLVIFVFLSFSYEAYYMGFFFKKFLFEKGSLIESHHLALKPTI